MTDARPDLAKTQLDVARRLSDLAGLQPGWLDGAGVALNGEGLRWATSLLISVEQELPRPYLYPTPEGRLQAEWSFHGAEVSAEIDLVSHDVELVGVHTRTRAVTEEKINLDQGVSTLIAFVTSFAP